MKMVVLMLSMCVFAVEVDAQGDIEAGRAKAKVCISCHGANGVATHAITPNLAGQKMPYIVISLRAYRDGERKGGNTAQMVSLAERMSEQDMKDIAAYFSSMPAAK